MGSKKWEVPGCTAVRLISKEGRAYWFRTCDIGGDVWKDGAHVVSFPAGTEISLAERETPLRFSHTVLGVTNNARNTWLLDGVNDAGLVGGLLALYEGTSVDRACEGYEGVMGMEILTFLLASCGGVDEVVQVARQIQILNIPHDGARVASTMHVMFVDRSGRCLILEAADAARPGMLTVYEENLGLMTNSPPYPQQLQNLSWYLSQSPEVRWGWAGKGIDSLTLNGLTVGADPEVPHFTQTGTFPASYAACDRFIRVAMLSFLNEEGRDFSDRQMLPLGSNLMNSVFEPHNQGIYHYIRLKEGRIPDGQHESYSQYLVMYDLENRTLYLRPYDSTAWTKVPLDHCAEGGIRIWAVCREALGGVTDGREADC